MTASLIDYPAVFHNRECFKGLISTNMEIDIDAKERADRMAAAEAMSALSAVIVNHGGDSPTSPRTSKRLASRGSRGGGRGRGRGRKSDNDGKLTNSDAKKSRSRTRANHDTTKSNVTETARNRPVRVTSKSKVGIAQEQAPKRSPRRRSKASVSESETPVKSRTKSTSSEYGDMPVLEPQVTKSVATPSLPSLPSNLSLTLPSLNIPSLATLPTLGSLSIFTTDTNGDKQPKKQDNKSLPFKKRRLINSDQGEDSEDQESRSERSQTQETASSTPSQAGRLAIDPGQQIRLFGEIQAALTADEDGDIPLHLAVVHEHLPLVQKFIQLMKIARRSVDRFNKDKQTPLHLAVKLNFIPGVKALLNAGADVNFVDKTGCTSLHLAVKHQLPECLKILVDGSRMEADFNTRNFEGLTPLHTAVELRNMGLMAYVLDHRADINMMDGKSGRTPLFHAAENNQEDVVEFLLKRAANPDVLNYAGSTALMAAQARNYNIVTKMLSRASDWNEEDRSGSSSPASEISVYIPDQANQKISGIWKHTVPLRNAATFNPSTGTFVGNASSNSVEVSLASQSPKKTKLIEGVHQAGSKPGKAAKTGGAGMKGSESPTTSNTSGAISGATATISQSAKTVLNMSNATSTTMSQPSFTISQTTARSRSPIDSGKIESAKSKSDSVNRSGKKGPPLYETLQNSEFNNSENLRAIDELAKKNPQVAFQFQKLLEAKQRGLMAAGINAANQEKQNHNGMKESEWDTAATQPDQKSRPAAAGSPSSSMSHRSSQPSGTSQSVEMSVSPRISHSPRMSHSPGMVNSPRTSNSPGGAPSPRASHSPGVTQPSGISQSSGTAQITNNLIPSTVTSRQESNVPRVVSAPSQVIGKVSHVVEKLPQQPERIISTGMVVEHPEYGLVFRPFGPGQIQRLNQTGSVPRTPASQEGKATEASEQEKDKPPEVAASSENSGTKETELIAEPPVSAKPADTGKTKESADSPKTIIPPATETVSSHPVTEKLLNSKPKMMTIPKSRPTDGNSRSQDSVSKPETSNAVKSIANSAIAAKLRQRVLNSPQVDAAKALANAPIHPTTTAKSSGAVMTAPERVPKLPQFGSRPSNMTNSSPTASPGQISTHPEGVSKILEHLSKPIEPSRPGVDLTKVKQEKTKKPEKRKKKDANGKNVEVKKKSVMLNKDNKKDWNEDSGSSEPMDT